MSKIPTNMIKNTYQKVTNLISPKQTDKTEELKHKELEMEFAKEEFIGYCYPGQESIIVPDEKLTKYLEDIQKSVKKQNRREEIENNRLMNERLARIAERFHQESATIAGYTLGTVIGQIVDKIRSKIPSKLEMKKQYVAIGDKQFAAISPDKRKVVFGEITRLSHKPSFRGSLPNVMASLKELDYKDGKLTVDGGNIDLLKLWQGQNPNEMMGYLISKSIDIK